MGEKREYYPLEPGNYPLSRREEPKHSIHSGPPGKKIVRIETAGGKVHAHEVVNLDEPPPKNAESRVQDEHRRFAKEKARRKRLLKQSRQRPNFYI